MKNAQLLGAICAFVFFTCLPAQAAVVEVDDLNIIDDAGNPSDGLRYLDLTYSECVTQADAIANAQTVYPDARLATPSNFDVLLAAAGIIYG